jgi:hypothetical protein
MNLQGKCKESGKSKGIKRVRKVNNSMSHRAGGLIFRGGLFFGPQEKRDNVKEKKEKN